MAEASHLLDKNALSGVRVLVVDDEPVLASTFCLVLQFAGAYAQSAGHGAHAIRELNRRGNTTPVLLFINTADYTGMEQIRDLRIHGTLTKPLLPGELVAAIRRTLASEPPDLHA